MRVAFTKEEEHMLTVLYPILENNVLSMALNRSESSLMQKQTK